MPCMCEHAGKKISTKQCNDAKECTINGDKAYAAQALIAVCSAKDDCGGDNAERNVAKECDALRLQVSAEDQFFREAYEKTECAPCETLQRIAGRHRHEFLRHLFLFLLGRGRFGHCGVVIAGLDLDLVLINFGFDDCPSDRERAENEHGCEPEEDGDYDFFSECRGVVWECSEQGTKRSLAQSKAEGDPEDSDEFDSGCEHVTNEKWTIAASGNPFLTCSLKRECE